MKAMWIAMVLSVSGCASYTQSKIDLTAQAQKGVALVRDEVATLHAREIASDDARRAKLDAAFDEDVAKHESLDPEWVIAHRKAYTFAIDAFDADRRSADANEANTLRTLDAVNAVLTQLQQMHQTELKLTLPEVKR